MNDTSFPDFTLQHGDWRASIALVAPAISTSSESLRQAVVVIADILNEDAYAVTIHHHETIVETVLAETHQPDLLLLDLRHDFVDVPKLLTCVAEIREGLRHLPLLMLVSSDMSCAWRRLLNELGQVAVFTHPMQSPKEAIHKYLRSVVIDEETTLRRDSLEGLGKAVRNPLFDRPELKLLLAGAPGKRSLSLISAFEAAGLSVTAAMSSSQAVQYLEATPFDAMVYFSPDHDASFPGLLRLVRRRDRFSLLPTFLVLKDASPEDADVRRQSGADFCYTTEDQDEHIVEEIIAIGKRHQKQRLQARFLAGTSDGETRLTRPLCSRSFLELHLARQCIEAERHGRAHSFILIHLDAEALPTAGKWPDSKQGLSRVMSEAAAYAAMLTDDIHLAGRLRADLLAISMPSALIEDADRMAAKIRDVLGQMAFRAGGTPFRLKLASACIQRRPGEAMLTMIARAQSHLTDPNYITTPPMTARKSQPVLSLVT